MFRKDISSTLRKHDFREVELEFRVGVIEVAESKNRNNPGKFVPNISKHLWCAAKQAYDVKCESGHVKSFVRNTVETYVETQNPKESSRFVVCDGKTTWEHKLKISNHTVVVTSPPHSRARFATEPFAPERSCGGSEFAIRASLALETSEPGYPTGHTITCRRTKRRTSYVEGMWKIDFTVVEQSPMEDIDVEETYEIEVELLDPRSFIDNELDFILDEGFKIAKQIVILPW